MTRNHSGEINAHWKKWPLWLEMGQISTKAASHRWPKPSPFCCRTNTHIWPWRQIRRSARPQSLDQPAWENFGQAPVHTSDLFQTNWWATQAWCYIPWKWKTRKSTTKKMHGQIQKWQFNGCRNPGWWTLRAFLWQSNVPSFWCSLGWATKCYWPVGTCWCQICSDPKLKTLICQATQRCMVGWRR